MIIFNTKSPPQSYVLPSPSELLICVSWVNPIMWDCKSHHASSVASTNSLASSDRGTIKQSKGCAWLVKPINCEILVGVQFPGKVDEPDKAIRIVHSRSYFMPILIFQLVDIKSRKYRCGEQPNLTLLFSEFVERVYVDTHR